MQTMKEKYGTIPSLKTTSQTSCGSSVLLRITLSPQTAPWAAAKACPAGTWGGSWGPTLASQAPQSVQETLSLASWVQPMLCTLGSSCSGRGLPARPRACRQQKTILHSGAFQQVRGLRKTKVLYLLFSSKGIMRLSYVSFLFLFLLPVLSKFPVEVHVKFIWRKKKTQVVILIPTKCRAAVIFQSVCSPGMPGCGFPLPCLPALCNQLWTQNSPCSFWLPPGWKQRFYKVSLLKPVNERTYLVSFLLASVWFRSWVPALKLLNIFRSCWDF